MLREILSGAAAGAAGTTALHATTYADMAIRGRPASSAPERAVDAAAGTVGAQVPGGEETRGNRRSGLGGLSGIAAGVTVGMAFGALRSFGFRPPPLAGALVAGTAAMAVTDVPAARLGITDPRSWSRSDWLTDLVPHLAYGAVTSTTLEALDRPRLPAWLDERIRGRLPQQLRLRKLRRRKLRRRQLRHAHPASGVAGRVRHGRLPQPLRDTGLDRAVR